MILALETASPITKLWLSQSPIAASPDVTWESGRQLADGLLGKIDELLKSKAVQLTDLTGIVIFSGPGSFTSLRIGHTTANALANSLGIPVVGHQGDDWLEQAITALSSAKSGNFAMPFYGSEANVTQRKA